MLCRVVLLVNVIRASLFVSCQFLVFMDIDPYSKFREGGLMR